MLQAPEGLFFFNDKIMKMLVISLEFIEAVIVISTSLRELKLIWRS